MLQISTVPSDFLKFSVECGEIEGYRDVNIEEMIMK